MSFLDPTSLLQNVRNLIVLVLSLTVHEWAHAYSAYKLGDDTADRQGRMTLNPLVHIDPIGTLLLPLLGVPFGWARPVPVNPVRFTRKLHMRTGMMLTASAGPVSNLVLSFLCLLTLALFARFSIESHALYELLSFGFEINVILALFNMLPIPPLDGSRVADWLMPTSLRPQWERAARFGPLILLAVIFVLPMMGISVMAWPVHQVETLVFTLVRAIVA